MPKLEIAQFPYLNDNYVVLIHDGVSGQTAAVDCGDAAVLLQALDQTGWQLSDLWVTHHHWDHTDGIIEVKNKTGCKVIGPQQKSAQIAGLDKMVWDGDQFKFAGKTVSVISTPAHTNDMINFYIPEDQLVFTGDTLFVLGCGRVFEGDAQMMWQSLQKLMALPPQTQVYCSHEYTLANAEFAVTVDPDNQLLADRKIEIEQLRSLGKPTVPTTIGDEIKTNPFLRPANRAIRQHLGMENASDSAVFAEIRKRKDNF